MGSHGGAQKVGETLVLSASLGPASGRSGICLRGYFGGWCGMTW